MRCRQAARAPPRMLQPPSSWQLASLLSRPQRACALGLPRRQGACPPPLQLRVGGRLAQRRACAQRWCAMRSAQNHLICLVEAEPTATHCRRTDVKCCGAPVAPPYMQAPRRLTRPLCFRAGRLSAAVQRAATVVDQSQHRALAVRAALRRLCLQPLKWLLFECGTTERVCSPSQKSRRRASSEAIHIAPSNAVNEAKMPVPQLPYKRPFFTITLNPHEIEVRGQLRRAKGLACVLNIPLERRWREGRHTGGGTDRPAARRSSPTPPATPRRTWRSLSPTPSGRAGCRGARRPRRSGTSSAWMMRIPDECLRARCSV